MRVKPKLIVFFLLVAAVLAVYVLFSGHNVNQPSETSHTVRNEENALESRIKYVENELTRNKQIIDDLKKTIENLLEQQRKAIQEMKESQEKESKNPDYSSLAVKLHGDRTFASVSSEDCITKSAAKTDIQMLDVYETLKFDQIDGGVWKQGWDVKYERNQWNDNQILKVFVVPHSHNDPGWIRTIEQYFSAQTKQILDFAVEKMPVYKKMKFIWAEISYLSMWWDQASAQQRTVMKSLIESGRIEIVSGGWVMTDEANSHYFAMLSQMIEGHEWMKIKLGTTPDNGWAIDPFGLSPTMAYLLKRMGLSNMVVQRVHYSVKKHLAREKSLEFRWKQTWDSSDSTDMFCHVMPFYSYDVPHTCGPDPKVCCQFDFKRLPGGRVTCPWLIPPKPITPQNVAERATTLLDQYRKKAQLFQTNVLLIPLGDDFRYDTTFEWDSQYKNYEAIMTYINNHPEHHAQIQFGTLSDYFGELRKEASQKSGGNIDNELQMFPSLSGDFFTYADREDHYWSGYYTTRPFHKHLDRINEHYLRSGELLLSMAFAQWEAVGVKLPSISRALMKDIVTARRHLALFQHHDAITGTAKDPVVINYSTKLVEGIRAIQRIMRRCIDFLLSDDPVGYSSTLPPGVVFSEEWHTPLFLPSYSQVNVEGERETTRVVLFNSLPRKRKQIVTVRVSKASVIVRDENEKVVVSQTNPIFDQSGIISNSVFELCFLAELSALSITQYTVEGVAEGDNAMHAQASVRVLNPNLMFQVDPFSVQKVDSFEEELIFKTPYIEAKFGKDGMLEGIRHAEDTVWTPLQFEFIHYGVRRAKERSGAYLFLPNGPADVEQVDSPTVWVIEGALLNKVKVLFRKGSIEVTVKNSPGVDGVGLHFNNEVDISSTANFEFGMRIKSNIDNGDEMYTDLNGFQVLRRKRFDKLPLQANFYPFPSLLWIEDSRRRLSIATRQPLGAASLKSGEIDIIMDRRLNQDDNRGLGQGITDNRLTDYQFTVMFEKREKSPAVAQTTGYPSLSTIEALNYLLYPVSVLLDAGLRRTSKMKFSAVENDLACDVQLVLLRSNLIAEGPGVDEMVPGNDTALIIHRTGFDCGFRALGLKCSTNGGKLTINELFPELFSEKVVQTSLSTLFDGADLRKDFTISLQPMELYSFILKR